MVGSKSDEGEEMDQDSGFTETDSRRKVRAPVLTESAISDWEAVSDVIHGYAALSTATTPWVNERLPGQMPLLVEKRSLQRSR